MANRIKHLYKRSTHLTKASLREVGANLLAVNLYMLGVLSERKPGYPHPQHAQNPRPILLVHGIIHNRSAFFSLKNKLEDSGFHNIYTINYTTRHGSLTKMVGDLAQRVEQILEETQAKQIDIVAHSLGGLVSRYYMSLGEGRGKVKNLVTLGTPHQGTMLSSILKFLPGSALSSDLSTKSYLLKTMNQTSLPRGSRIYSIYSHFDWTVWPKNNCKVLGEPTNAFKNIELDSIGHAGLLFDPKVLDLIRKVCADNP